MVVTTLPMQPSLFPQLFPLQTTPHVPEFVPVGITQVSGAVQFALEVHAAPLELASQTPASVAPLGLKQNCPPEQSVSVVHALPPVLRLHVTPPLIVPVLSLFSTHAVGD